GYSYRYYLWAERRYTDLLSEASGNKVLTIFIQILLDLIGILPADEDVLVGRVERVAEQSSHRQQVIKALLADDVELALAEARMSAARGTEWLNLSHAPEGSVRVRRRVLTR